MDLQQLVRAFNALPRNPKTPSGLVDNHWHFAIKYVPLEPPGDLLHIVNPGSHFTHVEGPAPGLSAITIDARADAILPLLLKSFVNNLGINDARMSAYAPWSWGTNEEDLAKALENRLKSAGVRQELCTIKVGDQEHMAVQNEAWEHFIDELKQRSGPQCTKCRKNPTGKTQKLQFCGACRKVQYCSRDCQKADWTEHKLICKYLANEVPAGQAASAISSSNVDAAEYYQTVAPTMPEAQDLAAEIGLTLPRPGGRPQGMIAPIRRLVATGKDTPENIAKFLGRQNDPEIEELHKETRFEVLLHPPKGSPMYTMRESLGLDHGCPQWTPRAPSAAEEEQLRGVREMQDIIRRHMGSRSMSDHKTQDMKDILVNNFGTNWAANLSRYTMALNAMDQGVRIG